MKRLMALLLTVAVLVSLVAACAPSSTPAPLKCDAYVVIAKYQKSTECGGTKCTIMSIEVTNNGTKDVCDVHFDRERFRGCPYDKIAWYSKPADWSATPSVACDFTAGLVKFKATATQHCIGPGESKIFGVAGAKPCGGLPSVVTFDCTDASGNLLYRGNASKITDP